MSIQTWLCLRLRRNCKLCCNFGFCCRFWLPCCCLSCCCRCKTWLTWFFFQTSRWFSSTGIDLHASVQTLLLLLSLLLLLPLWFLLSFLIVVLLLQLLSANTVVNQFEHPRRFFLSHLFSLFSLLLDPGKCDPCCSTVAPSMARHTASS